MWCKTGCNGQTVQLSVISGRCPSTGLRLSCFAALQPAQSDTAHWIRLVDGQTALLYLGSDTSHLTLDIDAGQGITLTLTLSRRALPPALLTPLLPDMPAASALSPAAIPHWWYTMQAWSHQWSTLFSCRCMVVAGHGRSCGCARTVWPDEQRSAQFQWLTAAVGLPPPNATATGHSCHDPLRLR